MKNRSETVSFRLNSEVAQLVDRARGPFGISRGEWVRGLVINHLQNDQIDKLAEELIQLRRTILDIHADSQSLHDSLRRFACVLLKQSEPLTPEMAEEGVRKIFGRQDRTDR